MTRNGIQKLLVSQLVFGEFYKNDDLSKKVRATVFPDLKKDGKRINGINGHYG